MRVTEESMVRMMFSDDGVGSVDLYVCVVCVGFQKCVVITSELEFWRTGTQKREVEERWWSQVSFED